ncbi:hypothetical protein BH10BAC4_BH10BAC4_08500 [soil metagenome]
MKPIKILLIIILSHSAVCCFGQFSDDFSDGDFTTNPTWQGDISKFAVITGKIKLQAPSMSESAFLVTQSQAIQHGSWEIYLQMDFAPSSTNYVKIYLVSDQPNLNLALNGYFIKAGNTSRDVSLYRQNGSVETKIIDGQDDRVNLSLVRIKIKATRSDTGVWQLYTDVGLSGLYSLEGLATDGVNTLSSYFGIQCVYTATRSDKFWFDDFVIDGTPVPDTSPPYVQFVNALNSHQVNLIFSEPLEINSAQNLFNYFLKEIGPPVNAILLADQKTVQLNFSQSLVNGVTYSLQISNVKDQVENEMLLADVSCLFFQTVASHSKDIVFTELFADTSPQIGLPNAEFVEIYNRSNNPYNVQGWKLTDGSSTGIFPSQIILPREYWIVTATSSVNLFAGFGKTIGLANFPTLNNDGDTFTLRNSEALVIDSISYNLDWYRDADKQQGGWSLELIDPANPCGEEDNWTASEAPLGGSPGLINSVFSNKPDLSAPILLTVFPESVTWLELTFNEKLDRSSLDLENFSLRSGEIIGKAFFKDFGLRNMILECSQQLAYGKAYTIEMKNIKDCNGNASDPSTFTFGLPEKPDSLDVLINEILFNPLAGGADFVELFNASEKFLNLKNWKLGNYKDGSVQNATALFTRNVLLPPRDFAVLSSNPSVVQLQYPNSIKPVLYKTSLPPFPDDEGSIVIVDDTSKQMDEVSYFKEWHSLFIKNEEGVSLERIESRAPSNDPANWTSASASVGFATPGSINSQQRMTYELNEDNVSVVPEVFSPGSGTEDFVQIQYKFENSPVANVKVYDPQGHLLRTLASNETLGTEGFLRWDGERDDGRMARMGYYIVWFEIFDPAGWTKVFRKRVIIAFR